MDKILEIKNLIVDYVSVNDNITSVLRAVNNVSFSINKGEIYALAGESGCGKSTIAKTLTRLIKPVSGEILFEVENVLEYSKDNIKKYLDLLKNGNGAGKVLITDKGKNLLKYMKTLTVPMRTADLAAGLGTAGRSLSPVVTKLVASGFVEKIGTSPALYIVTEKGKNFNLD